MLLIPENGVPCKENKILFCDGVEGFVIDVKNIFNVKFQCKFDSGKYHYLI